MSLASTAALALLIAQSPPDANQVPPSVSSTPAPPEITRPLPSVPPAAAPSPSAPRDGAVTSHFGEAGQVFILGKAGLDVGGEHDSTGPQSEDQFDLSLGFHTGYFFTPHLAAGGFLGTDVGIGGGATKVVLALGPSFTLRLGLAERISIAPRFSVGYEMIYTSLDDNGITYNGAVIDLSLPFTFELGAGLALAVGPQVTIAPLSASVGLYTESATVIQYGLDLGLLGWL